MFVALVRNFFGCPKKAARVDALAAKFPNYSHHYLDSSHSTVTSYPFEYAICAASLQVKSVL